MIWFNIKKLERKLASGNSSDKMAYQYFLAFLIVTVALAFFPKSAAGSSAISIAVLLVNLVVIIWGISKTMEININGGDRDYLKRFLSLSFVTGSRVVVYVIVISVILKTSGSLAEQFFPAFTDGVLFGSSAKLILSMVASYGFFSMLINSFRRVNDNQVLPETI